jgi:hypothetical protein
VQAEGEATEDGAIDADGPKLSLPKLIEATTRACAELEDRILECRMRSRGDIIKHFIQMLDLKFLQELSPLTTGMSARLSVLRSLCVISCECTSEPFGQFDSSRDPMCRMQALHPRSCPPSNSCS